MLHLTNVPPNSRSCSGGGKKITTAANPASNKSIITKIFNTIRKKTPLFRIVSEKGVL